MLSLHVFVQLCVAIDYTVSSMESMCFDGVILVSVEMTLCRGEVTTVSVQESVSRGVVLSCEEDFDAFLRHG